MPHEAAEAGPGFTRQIWQNSRKLKGVKHFFYSKEVLSELESTFSPERLSTYVRAVPGLDMEQARRLYICCVIDSTDGWHQAERCHRTAL